MKMKKVLACLFVIILTTGMFVGCSTEELALYKLSNDLTTLMYTKPVQSEGKIDLQLDVLPEAVTEYAGEEEAILTKTLEFVKANSLTYIIKSDVANKKIEANFNFVNEKTSAKIPLMTVLRNQDITYVKVDDYINFIKQNITNGTDTENKEVNAEIDKLFGDLQYLSVSEDEIIQFFNQMITSSMGTDETVAAEMGSMYEQLIKESLDPAYALEKQKLNNQIVEQLLQKAYKEYSLDIVKQEGNKYSVTLDATNLGKTVFGFADYSLEHTEDIGNTIKEFLNNLTVEQYSMLVGAYAIDNINKEMVAKSIDDLILDVKDNKIKYKSAIQQGLLMYDGMIKQYIDGSVVQMTKGKESDGTYTSDFKARIKISDPLTQLTEFDATLIINETVKEIAPFTVQVPTTNVTTFTEYLKLIPKVLSVDITSETYDMINLENAMMGFSEEIEVIMIDDYSYLPLRKVVEMFGEKIEWDNINKVAYIVRGDVKIKVDNVIVKNSTSYIKTREFEKLGYTVGWDGVTKTINITKK
ncbi:MAG: hypothetical protein CVU84_13510 [Firmicutes bacterium HGW-Firmicutes-1]|nr:MAG: hypothetical protein CVU84_13510 [Firmicutes bacterium HGW-Firmicutes-1]